MKAREVRRARLVARYAEKRKRLECYANSQSLQRHGASKRLYTSIWY